jgi:hypothetical protein
MSAIITAMRKELGLPDNDESWARIRRELDEMAKLPGDLSDLLAEMDRLSAMVPMEEWDALPTDLSENLDHYLYGVPKRSASR